MRDKIHNLKNNSRAIIMMSRWQPVLIGAVYALIATVMVNIIYYASGYVDVAEEYMKALTEGAQEIVVELPQLTAVDGILVAVMLLLLKMLAAGLNISMLMLSRGKMARVRDLFDGFATFFKTLAICIIRDLLTAVGLMLFVAPGLWIKYRYRYAIEALYDDETLSPIAALKRSAELTKGHKWELFVLDISFIFWRIGGALVSFVFSFSVLDAWITPYIGLAFAVNYNLLSKWEPSELDNEQPADSGENERYIIWKRTDKNPSEMPSEQAGASIVETVAQGAERNDTPPPQPTPEPGSKEKIPDIEYWKNRAIRIQQEMQQKKNDENGQ